MIASISFIIGCIYLYRYLGKLEKSLGDSPESTYIDKSITHVYHYYDNRTQHYTHNDEPTITIDKKSEEDS